MNCPKCHDSGWIEVENGMRRCVCKRRMEQQSLPLSTPEEAAVSIAAAEASDELGAMPDYPNGLEPAARRAVGEALAAMCSTPEQVDYVRRRALQLHRSWKSCGIPGLRQILIAKYRSRDGIEDGPLAISEAYPEGLPSEKDNLTGYQAAKAITPPSAAELHAIAPGLAEMKRLNPPPISPKPILPPDPPPLPEAVHPITAADIESVREKHAARQGATNAE